MHNQLVCLDRRSIRWSLCFEYKTSFAQVNQLELLYENSFIQWFSLETGLHSECTAYLGTCSNSRLISVVLPSLSYMNIPILRNHDLNSTK
jgi:hypothetical protein